MIDSHSDKSAPQDGDYKVGQDLYSASVDDMQGWTVVLRREILRLEAEIEKKQQERAAADSIFKKSG